MGNTCSGKAFNQPGGILGPPLEDFQNYSKPLDSLDRYDQFYRVVCYPIHCLQVETFFKELDKLLFQIEAEKREQREPRRLTRDSHARSDTDLVPYAKFMEYLSQSSFWPVEKLNGKSCFMKLLDIDGLFLQVKQYSDYRPAPAVKRSSRLRRPQSSDLRRVSHASCLSESRVFGEAVAEEGAKDDLVIDKDDLKQSIGPKVEPPSFKAGPFDTLEQIPQLREMFKMKLEPTLEQKTSVQTGPDLQLIAFNAKGQQLRNTQYVGTEQAKPSEIEERSIDIFSLKMLALLVCRGSLKTKAGLFMDAVIGRDGLAAGRDVVAINNSRLIRGTKKLTYFAEIFPKQYQDEFRAELRQPREMKLGGQSAANTEDTDGPSAHDQVVKNHEDLYWSKEYVMAAEEFLLNDLDDIYHNIFVSYLFGERDSTFSRREFLRNVLGGTLRRKSSWLFDPSMLRIKFRDCFDRDMDKDTNNE